MAGIIATWIKQKFKVPFILSEHWTIYLPQSNHQIKNLNLIYQKHLREILKKALLNRQEAYRVTMSTQAMP